MFYKVCADFKYCYMFHYTTYSAKEAREVAFRFTDSIVLQIYKDYTLDITNSIFNKNKNDFVLSKLPIIISKRMIRQFKKMNKPFHVKHGD